MNLLYILTTLWAIIKNWWWLPLPFILYKHFAFFWVYYRMEQYNTTVKRVLYEVKIPKEVVKPIKAMEQVVAGWHGIHDVFTWREKWLQGEFQLTLSLEIASIDGEIHFFIRGPESFRDIIESNIYSQYPEAEISIVEDYTKAVPPNIPNKDWDVFGFDMINTKPNPYPIRTYKEFEEARETKEEKRLDPLSNLLDGMASIGPGEQMWLQIGAKPIRDEVPWREEGQELVDKLVFRDKDKKKKVGPSIVGEAADVLITGRPPTTEVSEEKEERDFLPPEMKLTPGERETVKAIEDKISKFGFVVNIRCLYLGRRDVFFKPKARMFYGFFKNVSSESWGGLKPWKRTLPKVQWLLKRPRTHMRKKSLFLRYKRRFAHFFPRPSYSIFESGGQYIFNTEELATVYHFPGRTVAPAPGVPRVEAKKGEAPSGLPFAPTE